MYPQQPQQQYPYNPNYPPQGAGYPPQGVGYPPQAAEYPPATGYFQQQQGGGQSVNLNIGIQPNPNTDTGGGGGNNGGWNEPSGLFAEKAIRQAFVSKVYSILAVQLVFTSILIGFFVLHEPTKRYFASSQTLLFVGFGVFFVAYMILACVESARRSTPINFILLSIVTIGYGLVAAITSCRYDTTVVLSAFVATGASCFLIALFAKTTKFDMTNCGTTLCLIGLAQLVIGMILIAILVPAGKASLASLIISIGGAFVATLYLVFDLQLIMGGRKCELSPEEYILGAVMLYTDIIQIFIYLLEFFDQLNKD